MLTAIRINLLYMRLATCARSSRYLGMLLVETCFYGKTVKEQLFCKISLACWMNLLTQALLNLASFQKWN